MSSFSHPPSHWCTKCALIEIGSLSVIVASSPLSFLCRPNSELASIVGSVFRFFGFGVCCGLRFFLFLPVFGQNTSGSDLVSDLVFGSSYLVSGFP